MTTHETVAVQGDTFAYGYSHDDGHKYGRDNYAEDGTFLFREVWTDSGRAWYENQVGVEIFFNEDLY